MKIKSSQGFTLIELVVVIVILGILAATAAPKFMDLQSDARAASLKGVEAAIKAFDEIFYAKAVIQGKDKKCKSTNEVDLGDSNAFFNPMSCYGHMYPLRPEDLTRHLDIDTENDFYTYMNSTDGYRYIYLYRINPEFEQYEARERRNKYLELNNKCSVKYQINDKTGEVTVTSFTSDC